MINSNGTMIRLEILGILLIDKLVWKF